jgi:toxin ParE1/3/4
MKSCYYSSAANVDIEEIAFYLFDLDPIVASHFLDALEQACELLVRHPLIGRPRSELAEDLRSFPVGNYLVFYIPTIQGIDIVRVIYGGRDLPKQFHS